MDLRGMRKESRACEERRREKRKVVYKMEKAAAKNNKILQLSNIKKMSKDETWKFFEYMGRITSNSILERSYENINGAWAGEECYIIGAGPGLGEFIKKVGWNFLDGKHTIGINHTIEDYDRFEWFLFLDKRFLDKTTYDMNRYTGRVFAHCQTGKLPSEQNVIFHTGTDKPTLKIQDGLYNGNLSGLCALNLALIAGASKIYMIGFGMNGTGTKEAYHYKPSYTGEVKEEKIYNKFVRVQCQYNAFEPYVDRIIHVTDGDDCESLKNKMTLDNFILQNTQNKVEVSNRNPIICHISFSNKLSDHADITRYIIKEGFGKHILVSQNEIIPNADLYITEHFLSTDKFVNAFPKKSKTINIVHTVNCIPHDGFLKNIALTSAWKKVLEQYFVKNIEVIHGGIDLDPYAGITPTSEKVFGRITRWSAAKIHPEWNRIVKEILDEMPDSKCLIYSQLDQVNKRDILNHPRMVYDSSCKIDMFKGSFLKNMSVYVHMNGSFKDTLSFGVIEAMATGLPIVYLSEGTGVLEEVTGNAGIRCTSVDEVKKAIKELLKNEAMRIEYGSRARARAKTFDKNIMIKKFDEVIKSCLEK